MYHMPLHIEEFLYGSSMTIIAFLALILATPRIAATRKAAIIAIGLSSFFLTDLLFVQFIIFPQGQPPASGDSPSLRALSLH